MDFPGLQQQQRQTRAASAPEAALPYATVTYPTMPPLGTSAMPPLPHKAMKVFIPPVPTSLPVLSPNSNNNHPNGVGSSSSPANTTPSTTSPVSSVPSASSPVSPTSPQIEGGMLSPEAEAAADLQDQKAGKKRRRLTSEETRVLTGEFDKNPKPNAKLRAKLSMEIPGMTARAVQIWFQNRRQKWKMTKPKARPGSSSAGAAATIGLEERPGSSTPGKAEKSLSQSSSGSSLNNGGSTATTTPTPSAGELRPAKNYDGKRETKRPALGTGIRRYASDGALERKAGDESALLDWNPDSFWLKMAAGGGNPTSNDGDASNRDSREIEGGEGQVKAENGEASAGHRKSNSAPGASFSTRGEQVAVPELQNLSLEPSGTFFFFFFFFFPSLGRLNDFLYLFLLFFFSCLLFLGMEPLMSYAANLVAGKPFMMGGEEIRPPRGPSQAQVVNEQGRDEYFEPNPWPSVPPVPFSEQGNLNRRSGDLYPNLGVNMQMFYRAEDDPTHGLRKTRSAPNIFAIVQQQQQNGSSWPISSSITPPPEDLFWGSDLESEISEVLGRVSEDYQSDGDPGRTSFEGSKPFD